MSVIVAVQARMGSSRLPGKVLMPIGSRPAIGHVLERCIASGFPVWLCIPDTRENDPLGAYAASLECEVWRGPEHDVMARLAGVAQYSGCTHLVRVTGDCPLINPALIQEAVARVQAQDADYGCNLLPRTYPKGLDVQVYRRQFLRRLDIMTQKRGDREHVIPTMTTGETWVSVTQHEDQSHHRWVLDTEDDYRWFQRLNQVVPMIPPKPSTNDVLRAIQDDPTLGRYVSTGPERPRPSPPRREMKGDDDGLEFVST